MSTTIKKYRVVEENYPSGNGCYAGQDLSDEYIESCTTRTVIGEYYTLKLAQWAALETRNHNCQFDDWAEEYYEASLTKDKGGLWSFHTSDAGWEITADADEHTSIYIQDIALERKQKLREDAEKENALKRARASKAPIKKKKKAKTCGSGGAAADKERIFGQQKGNFKPDMNLFVRNPTRIRGGITKLPTEYVYQSGRTGREDPKHSYAYMMQRLSDRNYAMRGLCLNGDGARYHAFSKKGVLFKLIGWLPDQNLNDLGTDPSIVDTFHPDLVDSENGACLLTRENLLREVETSSKKDSLFFNHFYDGKAITEAITLCRGDLECVSICESALTPEIIQALQTSSSTLKGLIIDDCRNCVVTDEQLAKLLKACKHLKWLFVNQDIVDTESWRAISRAKNLEVLWINSMRYEEGRAGYASGDHTVIRSCINGLTNLKLCMINIDKKGNSRYGLGVKDRLTGDKVKMPSFDYWSD